MGAGRSVRRGAEEREAGGWERRGRMLRTGVQAGRAGAAGSKGRERRENEKRPNTRDILCVPQDLRQRGVAVIRPGEGRKLAGLGERGKHTGVAGVTVAAAAAEVRGRSFSSRSGERQREEGLGESREGGGDRLAWELGTLPGVSQWGSLR